MQVQFEPNPTEGTLDIMLSTIDKSPIHYTLDGTEPTVASPLYEGVLKVKEKCNFVCQSYSFFRRQQGAYREN